MGWRGAWAAVCVAIAMAASVGPAAAEETRYSLANGCFSLVDAATGDPVPEATSVRFRATRLSSYLLLLPDGRLLAASGGGGTQAVEQPGPAADWRTKPVPSGAFVLTPASGGQAMTVRLTRARGCADFPEASLGASGRPEPSDTDYGPVGGFVEGHMHWMTYEYLGGRFHCGRPWHPYGIPSALPDCSTIEGPQGAAAPVQNFLNFGLPESPHDTSGWPKLTEFRNDNLTYEGTYYRWVERAWLSGLRLMVMGVNENRILCELQATTRQTNCNEMDTVRRGFAAMHELEDYVDAQAGGPGEGFFEIVTDPYQARRVINEGRMAVVFEIEVSELFDCIGSRPAGCTKESIDRQIDEMHQLGVRSMLLLNKFDNPLTGVRFDGGPIGVLINAANRSSYGSFWDAEKCRDPGLTDNTIETVVPSGSALLSDLMGQLGTAPGLLPAYPEAPHCNTRGLTALGRHAVERMMDLGMIVNPDHMSQEAVDDTLRLLEERSYSGVISPHGWMDPDNWPRIWKLGGLAWPGHSAAEDYVDEWQEYRPRSTGFKFGWGYGADLGGLSGQPRANPKTEVSYPFRSYDGQVKFRRQTTGERTFDYRKEGVAHYGLYPEWFEDLRLTGGKRLASDMWDGAEAYLQMWERAEGVPVRGCDRSGGSIGKDGFGRLRLDVGWRTLLQRAGQPQDRGRAWSWCVKRGGDSADVAVLSESGRTELVGSTAPGHSAAGARVGQSGVPGGFKPIGGGVQASGTRVAVVKSGKVVAVGVATRRLGRSKPALRRAARRMAEVHASSIPGRYRPNRAQRRASSAGPPAGATLAGTDNPRLNAAFELLCRLQVQGL